MLLTEAGEPIVVSRGPGASRRSAFTAWRRQRPLVGGVLTSLSAFALFFSGQLDIGKFHVSLGIEGLQATVIPIMMLVLGILAIAMPQHRVFYGVISLVVAVYSLVGDNLGGFVIGMLLGSIGGILVVAWRPPATDSEGSEPRAGGTASEASTAGATATSATAAVQTTPPAPTADGRAHAEPVILPLSMTGPRTPVEERDDRGRP